MNKLLSMICLLAQTTERLEFSQETRQYFAEELKFPATQSAPLVKKGLTEVKIITTPLESGWRLQLTFPQEVKVKEELEDNSLHLEFNQGIDSPDLAKAQGKLTYLLKTFSNGFNTLYLVGSRPILYTVQIDHKTVSIDIIVDQNAPMPTSKFLKTACARLLVEKRRYQRAFEALDSLEVEEENKDAVILLSELEGLQPRWQRQVNVLERAYYEDPFDEDLWKLWAQSYSPHSPFLLYERQLQDTLHEAAVQVNRFQGEVIVRRTETYTFYLGAEYQFWRGHIAEITNSLGEAVGFLGTRNQGSLYIRNEWSNGFFCSWKFYAQEQSVYGAGAAWGGLIPPLQGDFWMSVDWNKPCWEIFEALAYQGREDRAVFHLNSVVNERFNWHVGGGARKVGITGTPTGYASILANASLFYNIMTTNPIFGLNYSFDAEYVEYIKEKIGIDGNPFNPVPLTSFEFHTFTAFCNYTWWDYWSVRLFAGETFNRLGVCSKTAGVDLRYQRPCRFDIELSATIFPSQVSPGFPEEVFSAIGTIRF